MVQIFLDLFDKKKFKESCFEDASLSLISVHRSLLVGFAKTRARKNIYIRI